MEEREPELKTMSLLDLVERRMRRARRVLRQRNAGLAWRRRRTGALMVPLDAVKELLEDAKVPKRVHDLKAALRVLESHGVALRGATDDVMLYSYLINPTHATHRLGDVAARFGGGPPHEAGDRQLTEAAHLTHALAATMRDEVDALGERRVYEEIDLPLVPVLLGMEKAGVRIDPGRAATDGGSAGGGYAARSERRFFRLRGSGSISTRRSSSAMCCSTRWGCRGR